MITSRVNQEQQPIDFILMKTINSIQMSIRETPHQTML